MTHNRHAPDDLKISPSPEPSKGFRGFMGRGPGFQEIPENARAPKSALRRLLRYFRPDLKTVAALIVSASLAAMLTAAAPAFIAEAVDALARGDLEGIPGILIALLTVYAFAAAGSLIQGAAGAGLSARLIKRLRRDLHEAVTGLPAAEINKRSRGDILSRMTSDADMVSDTVSMSLTALFSGSLLLLGTLAVMFWYSVTLTLIALGAIMLTMVITRLLTRFMRKQLLLRQELLGDVNGIVEESLTNYQACVACSMQKANQKSFDDSSDKLTKAAVLAETLANAMGPLMNTIGNLSFILVTVIGAVLAIRGVITVGTIAAFAVYARQLARPVNMLAQVYGQIQTALAGAERIFEIMDLPRESAAGAEVPAGVRGELEFRGVTFSYVPGTPVLKDFSLRIAPGEKVALAGATGSGKSTLICLLLRFYEPDSGVILLDGRDIREFAVKSLRKTLGTVLQDTVLFTDTLKGNLTAGAPEISEEELLKKLRECGADALIARIPGGLDAELANAGARLSQGERQLLSVARAYVADPPALILDEATSSLDTRTERHIQEALKTLTGKRTCLIVAHRLSTILDADRIIVMDHGRIAEEGRHHDLIARDGIYRKLFRSQYAGEAT